MNIYSHMLPGAEEEAMDAFAAALDGPPTNERPSNADSQDN